MSDVKRIKGNKIKNKKNEIDETSIFNDDLMVQEDVLNFKKIKTRKIGNSGILSKKELIQEKVNIDDPFYSSKENIKTNEVVAHGSKKVVGSRRIHGFDSKSSEQKLDKEIEIEDNLSIMVMIIILIICFLVGISLGYMLYRIAINSSNVMFIVTHFLK